MRTISEHPPAQPPAAIPKRPPVVAVIGNPNTGKTTVFNALTGLSQHTGNYPGVTVESALGEFTVDGSRFLAIDLPGMYSLAARSPDEMIAVEVLAGWGKETDPPDVIICLIDAANLERNLYLLTQVLEVGIPVVAALTMTDVAARQGIEIDIGSLERELGVPVVPVQANRRIGITDLKEAVAETAAGARPPVRRVRFTEAFDREVSTLTRRLTRDGDGPPLCRFLAERVLIDAGGFIEDTLSEELGATVRTAATEARTRLAAAGTPALQMEIDHRYDSISQVIDAAVRKPSSRPETWTDRIDRIITHKVWGLAIFLLAMAVTFQAIFTWAVPFMDGIDGLFRLIGMGVGAALAEGPLRSLMVDGVISGVGALVVFVPQIAILFGLITILEDSGYMARAAFLMDRVMAGFGLSGRSFIPLLSSFACAVPGIMSARTIENRRDRIATILIAPLMSCSARLPVYVLFIAAFIPDRTVWGIIGLQGLMLFAMYMLGLIAGPPIALLLKRTWLRGGAVPFLLELPPYKIPAWRVVLFRMYDRSLAFIRRAGTIILATTILVWALSYYPVDQTITEKYNALRATASTEHLARLDVEEAGERLRGSFLGQAGQAIEPLVKPLGWDWRIGMATLASFPAREVIIAALGTIYSLGSGLDEGSVELRQALRAAQWPDGTPVYNPVVAVSIMVFFALCCQCAATLATIRRETSSWGYPVFTFAYMTILAYLGAMAAYQIGTRIVGS